MNLKVVVTDSAQGNVWKIVDWLYERSPSGAETWYDRWLELLRELPSIASGCAVAPESDKYLDKIQQKLFKTRRGRIYRALFVVRESTIFVVHVRGPGQDLMLPLEIRVPQ